MTGLSEVESRGVGSGEREAKLRVTVTSAGERQGLRSLNELPGPEGLPYFGIAFQLQPESFHLIVEQWARRYGSLFAAKFFGYPVLVVSDPVFIDAILRARPHLIRRHSPLDLVLGELGTRGVFTAEGQAWKDQRRLVMQVLSQKNLKGFFPTLQRSTERLLGRWQSQIDAGEETNAPKDFLSFSLDVTVSLAFSTDMNTLEGGDDALQSHLSLLFPAFTRRLLSPFPYWRYFRLARDRRLDLAVREIRELQAVFLTEARQRLAERPADSEPRDFLEAVLASRDEQGRPFSDDVIHGNMMTMLLAGEDTTAHTLAWAVHLLCDHPKVLARMRSEVDAKLGQALVPTHFAGAQDFPYVDAVIHEVMRLKPVGLVQPFEPLDDLAVGDWFVPKASVIEVLLRPPVSSEEYFTDAAAFKPERWLGELPAGSVHEGGVSLPFGSGPRICPGRALALLEMRVVLAMLVRNFELTRVGTSEQVSERFGFVMTPHGLQVGLARRVD